MNIGRKYRCSECGKDIISNYLFTFDRLTCPHCGKETFVPENAMHTSEPSNITGSGTNTHLPQTDDQSTEALRTTSSTMEQQYYSKRIKIEEPKKETNLEELEKDYKYKDKTFFSEKAIAVAMYIGGPLAVGLLLRQNYNMMEKQDKAKLSLFGGVFAMLVFIGFSLFWEIDDRLVSRILRIIPSILTYYLVIYLMGKQLKIHRKLGYKLRRWYETLGHSLFAMIVVILIVVGLAMFMPPMDDDYIRVGEFNSYMFYDESLNQEELDLFKEALLKAGIFNQSEEIYVKVDKDENGYRLMIPVDSEYWSDLEIIEYLKVLKTFLNSNYFNEGIGIYMFEETWSGKIIKKEI